MSNEQDKDKPVSLKPSFAGQAEGNKRELIRRIAQQGSSLPASFYVPPRFGH